MSGPQGCSQEVLSKLVEALSESFPNANTLATAICQATTKIPTNANGKIAMLSYGLNQLYLLFGTALVFVMHGGFAMLAAGAIRSKNAVNILLQTLMDACASAVMWYLVGFGFAYGVGDNPNAFIGDALFGLARIGSHHTGSDTGRWLDVVFQWAFCATAVTIPAGSVAERCNFNAYLCYSSFISAILYPVVAHWVWCSKGWLGYGTLKPLLGCGMMDFAGSSVVHMLGGLSGLAGAVLLGPRMGRFDVNNEPLPLPGHSAVLVVLGTVLLWFGWYGFNPVSTLFIDTAAAAEVASRSAVTTTLAGAAGGVGCLAWTLMRTKTFDLYALCNGVLCGFVAVTAGCHVYEPWAAIICGAGAGIIFDLACMLLLKLNIDDPLGAAPMHGGCGAYGVLFVGLLAKKDYITQSYTRTSYPNGLFYGGGGRLLACQVIGLLAIAGWTLGLMFPFFFILKRLNLLRVPPEEELDGLDISRHCGRAYNIEQYEGPLLTQLTTYKKGAVPTVKEQEGAVGDAIMRAEVVGAPQGVWQVGQQQQQKAGKFTSPSMRLAPGELQFQPSQHKAQQKAGPVPGQTTSFKSGAASPLQPRVSGGLSSPVGPTLLAMQDMPQEMMPETMESRSLPLPGTLEAQRSAQLQKVGSQSLAPVGSTTLQQQQRSGALEMQKSIGSGAGGSSATQLQQMGSAGGGLSPKASAAASVADGQTGALQAWKSGSEHGVAGAGAALPQVPSGGLVARSVASSEGRPGTPLLLAHLPPREPQMPGMLFTKSAKGLKTSGSAGSAVDGGGVSKAGEDAVSEVGGGARVDSAASAQRTDAEEGEGQGGGLLTVWAMDE